MSAISTVITVANIAFIEHRGSFSKATCIVCQAFSHAITLCSQFNFGTSVYLYGYGNRL